MIFAELGYNFGNGDGSFNYTRDLSYELRHLERSKMNEAEELLREKLADIEHQRWADWQNWVHKVYLEGNFGEFMLRWQKQIATPYSELSAQEKASDMEQVDRYWPLITTYISDNYVKKEEK